MRVYAYTLDGAKAQYAGMDAAIRSAQFVRTTCLRRLWREVPGTSADDLQVHCRQLAHDVPFAAQRTSQARQAAADRA